MPAHDLVIHNVTAVDADGVTPGAWVQVVDGKIAARGVGIGWPRSAEVHDGGGGYLTPGFIDIHMHGGGGHSNEDGPTAILAALAAHHRHGTTRAVTSLVAAPLEALESALDSVATLTTQNPLLLGSHLEGPFLAPERKGAHNSDHFRDPQPEAVQRLLTAAAGTLSQITLDPARPESPGAIRAFCEAEVVVAVGHTDIGYAESRRAFDSGASILTHSFNAMRGIHHREPGPVVAAIDSDGVFLELILDGEHVHPSMAALLFTAAPGRVVLITDAMAAAGVPDGQYRLGDLDVTVDHRRAVLTGSSVLAGSTLTLDSALRAGIAAGIEPQAVVGALTLSPARALRLDRRLGRLTPGYEADLVTFDQAWQVQTVRAEGKSLI